MTDRTTQQYTVSQDQDETRLDLVLAEMLHISRSQAKKMVDEGRVLVNEKAPRKAGDTLSTGSTIEILPIPEEILESQEAQVEEDATLYDEILVIEENDEYLVIAKPSGLLVHQTEAKEPITLDAWFVDRCPDVKGVGDSAVRPGIVHRLDKDASGVMVLAKTQAMFDHLKKQFAERSVEKHYRVLVHGTMENPSGKIDFRIDRGNDGLMVARPYIDMMKIKNVGKKQPGKEALTEYVVLDQYARFALLDVKIRTGRTHQIRVHMYAIDHPIVGDQLYYNKKLNRKRDEELGRLFLHAFSLGFSDLGGERHSFEAPLPEELETFLTDIE